MSFLSAVATALPAHSADNSQITDAVELWLGKESQELQRFKHFLSAANTKQRFFCIPPREIVRLRGLQQKSQIFEECAPVFGEQVARQVLEMSKIEPTQVEALIFCSCSCPAIPAIDTLIIERLGLSPHTMRLPIYQNGCAGGILGLGLAHDLCTRYKNVLLISVELCSLVFQPTDISAASLVGAAIFGDGAAATVLTKNFGEYEILARRSTLIPGSRHIMGYDLLDSGSHLRLSKDLPTFLFQHLPQLSTQFLQDCGLKKNDIDWWLMHPGGAKVLDILENALQLSKEQTHWSRDTLYEVGNLSSASILFVIQRFIEAKVAKPGDHVLLIGMGPGMTLEHILLRKI